VLEEGFTSAGIAVSATGEANCPFKYGSWDEFWRGTRAAGPAQAAIGRAVRLNASSTTPLTSFDRGESSVRSGSV
jgi:hypothetical protein